MGNDYTRVPLFATEDDSAALDAQDGGDRRRRRCGSLYEGVKNVLYLVLLLLLAIVLGFCVGRKHPQMNMGGGVGLGSSGGRLDNGLLPAQAFVAEIPMKEVKFDFPTAYEDTSIDGDKLWDDLMPVGSGFVRVPHPRQYDMPASKAIEGDPEDAEIYSVSALHQLHCLGVIRDVIKKYESHSKSRFAGAGHEYHCIDYLRQSIMCAGDTTLDYAEAHAGDGRRTGFSGANSTHQCRDWDALVGWAVENRAGDKKGIA
ncbi:hypothetical protein M406DRAFT_327269 [Cryphonectria parasitica EP155]|uniref:Oxidase ustYa n=1 Tax=Cryphonectria parasitica (strain ATCC 38755 / EP155) TaxID=660469 RepID=A0A9P4Y8Q2_CRYP1|nr:uncharacterized protein M406DRAFT_327269 [Cryphonectria parasitica EP155]KAF3768853.1 hypothetical protein M406DRAFT_327269 [Cryphonectria parasitica EP155]